VLASSYLPEFYRTAMKGLCDEDCSALERIYRGDDQAIALVYDRYSIVVYSIALRVLRDPALAEQVLLVIFMEIWRSPGRFMKITGNQYSGTPAF